jgi:hypothetical protein
MDMGSQARSNHADLRQERLGRVIDGVPQRIGTGFSALHFSEEMFEGRMDPFLMVDHFVMTAPTFAPHMHAGISAVTAMFEDSEGSFLNRDTLGHNIALKAGDLYWLTAASGAAHEEKPEDGARTHALQIFVNLPAHLKKAPARALYVRTEEVPLLEGEDYRVRVVLGSSGGVTGATATPGNITLLDGSLEPGGEFVHTLAEGQQAWVYAVSGQLAVRTQGEVRVLESGQSTTVGAGPATDLIFESNVPTHFAMLAGSPIREPFVKHGPLVLSTATEIRQTLASYAAGKFGHIPT